MLFEIKHITSYTYSEPVFFEPVTIRLRPVCNSLQNVHSFEIRIDPEPAGQTYVSDLYGNDTVTAWFNGIHPKLEISTRSRVETLLDNPYNFIVTDRGVDTVPVREHVYNVEIVKPYLKNIFENKELLKLVNSIMEKEKNSTLGYINAFCGYIYDNFKQIIRESGHPHSPDTTIGLGEGACRDLTVLMVEAMRLVNLPARFTSGYCYGTGENVQEELHSWAEVYIPGGGWRGFDPNLGLSIDNNYIKVASGVSHFEAAPVSGTFRGNNIETRLDYDVKIQSID